MSGTWRFKVGFGAFGALLIFFISLSNNPIGTTLLRSLYGFIAFAALAFAVGFVLDQLLVPGNKPAATDSEDGERGGALDLVTPDDGESLSEMMKEQWTGGKREAAQEEAIKGFQPLQPKRLVSLDNPNPEEVVQAIRRLTDE